MSAWLPILFSAPMVNAILAGKKTKTRRVQPLNEKTVLSASQRKIGFQFNPDLARPSNLAPGFPRLFVPSRHPDEEHMRWEDCGGECLHPRYFTGSKLWVRETWLQLDPDMWLDPRKPSDLLLHVGKNPRVNSIAYRAECDADSDRIRAEYGYKWKPSIFMPPWASRIHLEVTDVKLERVQDITEEEAAAEGAEFVEANYNVPCEICGEPLDGCDCVGNVNRFQFRCLWDELNEDRGFGWDKNPWVWNISFKRIDAKPV